VEKVMYCAMILSNTSKKNKMKNSMDKKKLMSQVTQPINNLTIQDLPNELAELSGEDLSQVRGGLIFLGDSYNVGVREPLFPPPLFPPACDWPIFHNPDIAEYSRIDHTAFAL
jgi:hypothetical protein